jgi:hypothetical protein
VVRRFLLVLAALSWVGMAAWPADAQGKDPFRPPGPEVPADRPPLVDTPFVPTSTDDPSFSDDGLARTGQDVSVPFVTGLGLLALGGALSVISRVLSSSVVARWIRGVG